MKSHDQEDVLFSILKICVYDIYESGMHVCDVCSACDVYKMCSVCVMCVHMYLCMMDTCFESSLMPSSCCCPDSKQSENG